MWVGKDRGSENQVLRPKTLHTEVCRLSLLHPKGAMVQKRPAGTSKHAVETLTTSKRQHDTKYDKVVLVRSLIPTREIGFLPGDEDDKSALYQVPYSNMVQFMFEMPNEQSFTNLYERLKAQGTFLT